MTENIIDGQKLLFHPVRVAEWLDKGDCYPIYVEIGLTNRCNHNCIFCALDWLGHDGANIESKIMFKTLEEMAYYGVKSVMFAGEGEPLLHRDVSNFIRFGEKVGLKVAVTTNGVLFDKEKTESCLPYLSWIRFSVDAGTPEAYSKIHQTKKEDFQKVISNIRYAVELKREKNLIVDIGIQALLIPESIESMKNLVQLAKDIGVDNVQVKPYSQHPLSRNYLAKNMDAHIGLESELRFYESEKFKVFFRRNTIQRLLNMPEYESCYGLPFFSLIDARGNIIPCNLYYDNFDFTYGNLYEESFKDIWNGKKRQKVLINISNRNIRSCRQACRLDPINQYLHRLKNPKPRDDYI